MMQLKLKLKKKEIDILNENGLLYKKLNDGNRIKIYPNHVDNRGIIELENIELFRPKKRR